MRPAVAIPFIPLILLCVLPGFIAGAGDVFVEKGQKGWKYWDMADSPGDTWMQPDFDDSGWKEGQAPLGYGDKSVRTEIGFGDDAGRKHPAAYFRLTFQVEDPAAHEAHYLMIRFDDGVRIHLNGKFLDALNMPGAEPAPGAYTGKSLGPGVLLQYFGFSLEKKLLVKGKNTIAISLHQSSASSSDLFLDLDIRGMTVKEMKELEEAEAEKTKAAKAAADAEARKN